MSFLSWLTDRLVLEPTRHVISASQRKALHLDHGDEELESWVHRVGRHCTGRPDLYLLEFPRTASRAEDSTDFVEACWSGQCVKIWAVNPPGYGKSTGTASVRKVILAQSAWWHFRWVRRLIAAQVPAELDSLANAGKGSGVPPRFAPRSRRVSPASGSMATSVSDQTLPIQTRLSGSQTTPLAPRKRMPSARTSASEQPCEFFVNRLREHCARRRAQQGRPCPACAASGAPALGRESPCRESCSGGGKYSSTARSACRRP